MRPGGRLLLSSFGPRTLNELREAFAAADAVEHVSQFAPIQQIGDALLAAGFRDPVLDQDTYTLTYSDLPALLHELQAIAATNALTVRRSEERRVGKECVRTCNSRWSPANKK